MKRLVSLLLCLAMLLCMLAACGETPQTSEQTPSTGGDQPTDGTASGNADLIRLIFPDGSSDGLMAAVTRLHSALTDAGINLKKVSDGLADNVTNADGEILVGATNRPASQNFVTNAQAGR